MSYETMPNVEHAEELGRVKEMAAHIASNTHLQDVLKAAKPVLRRSVYDQIKPFLKFKPVPYWALKF